MTLSTSFQTSNKIRKPSKSNTKRLLRRTNQIGTKKRAANLKVANLWKNSTSTFTVLHPGSTLFGPRMGFCQIRIFNSLKASLPLSTTIKVKKQEAQWAFWKVSWWFKKSSQRMTIRIQSLKALSNYRRTDSIMPLITWLTQGFTRVWSPKKKLPHEP